MSQPLHEQENLLTQSNDITQGP